MIFGYSWYMSYVYHCVYVSLVVLLVILFFLPTSAQQNDPFPKLYGAKSFAPFPWLCTWVSIGFNGF